MTETKARAACGPEKTRPGNTRSAEQIRPEVLFQLAGWAREKWLSGFVEPIVGTGTEAGGKKRKKKKARKATACRLWSGALRPHT